ncbi:hypothetical protein DFH28DRAFT_1217629 [Melampsora americana]|nr:hypothetical protein DFH28DRAFT_1217629 [Melampsora americana]
MNQVHQIKKKKRSKLEKVCKICQKVNSIYLCPLDQIPYCSVLCFNLHKQQTNCPGTRSKIEKDLNEIKEIKIKSIKETQEVKVMIEEEEEVEEERPLKRLKDLNWPELDEAQSSVFYDPLRREEIKPLRRFEWESIATSSELRSFLKTCDPSFKKTLQTIHLESNLNSRDQLIKELLGFRFESNHSNLLQTHHLHQRIQFNVNDQNTFEKFSEIIKKILDQTRGS